MPKDAGLVMSKENVQDFFLDFGIYMFCVVGVLASRWIPMFKDSREIPVDQIGLGELLFAMVVAFIVVFAFDQEGDKKGKRSAFRRRAAFALAQGFMWDTVIGG